MKWKRSPLLLTVSGSWLGFRLWQAIQFQRELDHYRKIHSPSADMMLEATQPRVVSLLTWLAVVGFVVGFVILIDELIRVLQT